MPTSKYFSQYPSVPSDPTVHIANIPTLCLTKLQASTDAESLRLYEACLQQGFILLDLRGSVEGENLLHDSEKMFDLIGQTLTLNQETRNKYACDAPRDLVGYKRSSMLKTDDGGKDSIEAYTLSQDDILGNVPPRANPETIESHRKECREFFQNAHAVVTILLDNLDKHLDLQPGTLSARCSLNKHSATTVRMLLSHAQPAIDNTRIKLGGHTDIGLITLLFNIVGGLQVLPTGAENRDENWRYIRPQPGCAVINIGDTLSEWTGGLLRSALHRVVSPPGDQARVPRLSLAFLVKAERNATVERLKGSRVIPALEKGEEEDMRSVDVWARWRARQIMDGELKAQTRGGK